MRELITNDQQRITTAYTSSLPSRKHIPASPYAPPDRPLFGHMGELFTGDPQYDVIRTPSSPSQEHVPTSPPTLTPPDNLAFDAAMRELLQNDRHCLNAVGTPPSPTQEHIPTLPPTPSNKPLSDHIYELSPDDQQYVNATSTSSSSTQDHVPTSQPSPLRTQTPPDKLHPTLSSWMENMNKLSGLIDRLQELASSAPEEHRSQLLRQVVALRATSDKQQKHFMEFLQLSEEYANKYLLDISAEIEQQSSFLDKLKERLEAAEKLRGDAVDLQMFYESETVDTMKNFRATGKAASYRLQRQNIDALFSALSRPLSEDHALFNEVDSVLTEIRQCYMEMDKFWGEEISRVIKALEMRRVDPTDFKRWKDFHANLEQTIESWKVQHVFLSLCHAVPTGQNALFRMSHQAVVPNHYVATMHARQRSAHSGFHFGILYIDCA